MSVTDAVRRAVVASHLTGAHDLPALFATFATDLGFAEGLLYLADLQQNFLVPFVGAQGPTADGAPLALPVEGTLAGRCYQHVETVTRDVPGGRRQLWFPLLDGTDRLGVATVTLEPDQLQEPDIEGRLQIFAGLAADLVVTKTLYGDTIVRLRRQAPMGLAAELQWSVLPPLTFACREVTVAAALEPAYSVAGDTVDYAVDAGRARVAIFDSMGHGLRSSQLAALTVAAYRNARRADRSLPDTVRFMDAALSEAWQGDGFATAVLAELDTATGRLDWVSAGHPEPLLLRDGRLVRTLHVDPVLPLGLGDVGLVSPDGPPSPVAVGTEQLQPGDRVLLYTDGVTEARSPDGEFFGAERLAELVTRHLAGGLPTPETMRRVVHALLEHQQGQLDDDATLLLLEWKTGRQEELVPEMNLTSGGAHEG